MEDIALRKLNTLTRVVEDYEARLWDIQEREEDIMEAIDEFGGVKEVVEDLKMVMDSVLKAFQSLKDIHKDTKIKLDLVDMQLQQYQSKQLASLHERRMRALKEQAKMYGEEFTGFEPTENGDQLG